MHRGWYKWTLGLTYDTMLGGVPGTGTRNNGLSGQMLRVNLDHIVLLRFHGMFCFMDTMSDGGPTIHHPCLPFPIIRTFHSLRLPSLLSFDSNMPKSCSPCYIFVPSCRLADQRYWRLQRDSFKLRFRDTERNRMHVGCYRL